MCVVVKMFYFLSISKGAFTNRSRGPYAELNYTSQIVVFTRRTSPRDDLWKPHKLETCTAPVKSHWNSQLPILISWVKPDREIFSRPSTHASERSSLLCCYGGSSQSEAW